LGRPDKEKATGFIGVTEQCVEKNPVNLFCEETATSAKARTIRPLMKRYIVSTKPFNPLSEDFFMM